MVAEARTWLCCPLQAANLRPHERHAVSHAVTDIEPPVRSSGTGPAVRLVALRKSYGRVVAADGVDLEIAQGEFFTMLGPSGSGKTTLLRVIAGFEQPDGGVVELGGADVTRQPPYARNVNTVFQDYALFPHMTVVENVEYGLKIRRVPRPERRRRAQQMLDMVRLSGLGGRKPLQLSGGQRQRVALARAIVNEPEVLLLDEPLGALDLKLRQEMQTELKRIQREVGITFIYVTHDQEEALTMSDRLAVLNRGQIEQVGTPIHVYEQPATEFVAGFIGVSNLIDRDGYRLTVRPEKVHLLLDEADRRRRAPTWSAEWSPRWSTSASSRVIVSTSTAVANSWPCARTSRRPPLKCSRPAAGTPGWRGGRTRHIGSGRRRPAALPGSEVVQEKERDMSYRRFSHRSAQGAAVAIALTVPLLVGGGARAVASPGAAAASAAVGLTPPTQNMTPQSSIGKGEGQLNLIAWEGYAQHEWVKPFEKQTGCHVNTKYAGSSSEMVSLMANGGGGQYDLVSASGDADLRLVYGGDVKPVNINLVPSWKQFRPFLQSPAFNTINGVHYGVSLQFGPTTCCTRPRSSPRPRRRGR